MTSQFYVVLAFFFAVVIGLILLFQRIDRLAAQAVAVAKRQDEAEAALRAHVTVSTEKLEQRLQRMLDAEVKSQQVIDTLLRAQHAAVEANSKATDQLSGAIHDLRAALIESTKL